MTYHAKPPQEQRLSMQTRRALADLLKAPLRRYGRSPHWVGISGVHRQEHVNKLRNRGLVELDLEHDASGRTAIPTVIGRSVAISN